MLLKVKNVIGNEIIINTNMIIYIMRNKVYFTPTTYMEVRQIDITNIKKVMKQEDLG